MIKERCPHLERVGQRALRLIPPYLHSYPRGVERVHPRCLPLECMTGMTPPLSPGLSPLLTRPVCTGTNPARTLHTYNVVVSILGEDQKGSQGGWLVRLNRSH